MKGFTLIELLVVVLIIGILSAVALPEYTKAVEKSYSAEALGLLNNVLTAEKAYKLGNGVFTADLTRLDLEMPNIKADKTDTFITKNWRVTVRLYQSGGEFRAFAARAKDGVDMGGWMGWYGIELQVDSTGKITRRCKASDAGSFKMPDICKSIAGSADGVFK